MIAILKKNASAEAEQHLVEWIQNKASRRM